MSQRKCFKRSSAQVLGLDEFDEDVFLEQVEKIVVNGKINSSFIFMMERSLLSIGNLQPGLIGGHRKPVQQSLPTAKRTLAVQEPSLAFPEK
jgi:hypothetical protein